MTQERRENHNECGDNRQRKYSKRVLGGTIWYCHNCGEKGFVSNGLSTPRETVSNVIYSKQSRDGSLEQVVQNVRLPYDITYNVPPLGLGWLYKYYITDDEIKKYNICYSEQYQRLILPVYDDTGLIYWQGRSLKPPYTKENPKYINIRRSGAKNVFFKVINPLYRSECLVVVEDVLSAIRVGRTHNSLALLGSYFPLQLLNIFKQYKQLIFYLDADKRDTSIKAAIKFNKLTNNPIRVVYNICDPKELSPKSLEELLND